MIFGLKKLNKSLLFLALIALIAIFSLSFFGLNMHNSVSNTQSHEASRCPFVIGDYSLCATNVFKHISAWKDLMTGISLKTLSSLYQLLAFFLIFYFLLKKTAPPPADWAYKYRERSFTANKYLSQFLGWLSLFELSPSLYSGRN